MNELENPDELFGIKVVFSKEGWGLSLPLKFGQVKNIYVVYPGEGEIYFCDCDRRRFDVEIKLVGQKIWLKEVTEAIIPKIAYIDWPPAE